MIGLVFAAALTTSGPLYPMQTARLDQVGEMLASAALCGMVGYRVVDSQATATLDRAASEASRAGMPLADARSEGRKAFDRYAARIKSDLQTAISAIDRGGYARGAVESIFTHGAEVCLEASKDALTAPMFKAPPNPQEKLVEAMDRLLEPAGQASWQTEDTTKITDYLMTAGACRSRVSTAELTRYTNPFIGGPVPANAIAAKRYRYFQRWFVAGIETAGDLDLTAAQCKRLLDDPPPAPGQISQTEKASSQ